MKPTIKGNKHTAPKNVIPQGCTNVLTDNKTTSDGRVINKLSDDANFCRNAVNENHK